VRADDPYKPLAPEFPLWLRIGESSLHQDQESRNGAGGIVGMKCRKDHVTRESRLDGISAVSRSRISPIMNDIGVLPHDMAQGIGKIEADLGFDLYLVDFP